MKKNLEYHQSTYKTKDGQLWYKCLENKNVREIYEEQNIFRQIKFYI